MGRRFGVENLLKNHRFSDKSQLYIMKALSDRQRIGQNSAYRSPKWYRIEDFRHRQALNQSKLCLSVPCG